MILDKLAAKGSLGLLIFDFRQLLAMENVSLPVNVLPKPGYFYKNRLFE
jgi:hypothetical protein